MVTFLLNSAEAYHFYILSQKQLYEGRTEDAMCTAMRLIHYEDILDPVDIYSLIAIASYYAKHYGNCSKAFIRLETLDLPQVYYQLNRIMCLYCIFMFDFEH